MAIAQTRTITGYVISEEDGQPVIGASVVVTGASSKGTVTDTDGKFTLEEVSVEFKTLTVSFIGMQTQEVEIKSGALRIVLRPDTETLDEVMVIAYGTAKKSAFTGSASVVKAETLEKRQVSNVSNALSGTMAGVQTTSSNGQPGVSSTVRIRGIGSINAGNAPLYVVDGIPYDGGLDAINSQDIESMTVLKDAAAAALYGARGANGVILITTKKGSSGAARVTVEARWGANSRQVTNYDVMQNPATYMEKAYESLYNAGIYNLNYNPAKANQYANNTLNSALGYQIYTVPKGQSLVGMNGKLNPNATLGYSDGTYTYLPDKWADEMFSSRLRQEYNVSIRGGSEKFKYYFSAAYLSDQGIIENSDLERISTRLNLDYDVKKWLKIGTNMSYSNNSSRYPSEQTATASSGNAFFLANMIAPVYPMYVRDEKGNILIDKNTGYKIYDYGDGKSTPHTRNFMAMANPMSVLLYNQEQYLMDILDGKWYAAITPLEGLTLTATLGLHVDNTRLHGSANRYYGQDANYGGSSSQEYNRYYSLNRQYLANYKKQFGLHNLDVLVGYEGYEYQTENLYAYGYNTYQDNSYVVNNTIDRRYGGGSASFYATEGIFSRVDYNYDSKYYGSVSYRRDASSRFHPDNRWGNFWSISGAWDLAKEGFLSGASDWVNHLKLKASFGQQGNDNIGNNYAYTDQFSVTGADGVFSDANLAYKGNPDITWETSNSFNVGVDFSLWSDKLSGTIEYFNRQTKDMLYYKPVAPSNGYGSIPMNIGSMRNAGLEVELNYKPIHTNNFKWDVTFNATYLKNTILKLYSALNGELIVDPYVYQEGKSIYQFYLVQYAGVDEATGKALYWAKDEQGNPITTDNLSVANNYREASGSILPKVYGGLGTALEFHGFDFSIQCAYQLGGTIFDSGYQRLMHGGIAGDMGSNWHKDILDSWSETNTKSNVPRVDYNDQYANSTSSRWLTSSDYFSINNITFGYTFPQRFTNRLGIGSLRLYGAADNVALITARKGLDPRMGYLTATTALYTTMRTISGGIKLTF
jgi:TonB-linked SusC/RagA family outer membrane protein